MGFRKASGWDTRSKRENDLEEAKKQLQSLSEKIRQQEKNCLSRVFIRDAGFFEMKNAKDAIRKDGQELEKLKRKIAKLEEL